MTRLTLIDDVDLAATTNNDVVWTALFDRGFNFHNLKLHSFGDPALAPIRVWYDSDLVADQHPDAELPHLTREVCKYRLVRPLYHDSKERVG